MTRRTPSDKKGYVVPPPSPEVAPGMSAFADILSREKAEPPKPPAWRDRWFCPYHLYTCTSPEDHLSHPALKLAKDPATEPWTLRTLAGEAGRTKGLFTALLENPSSDKRVLAELTDLCGLGGWRGNRTPDEALENLLAMLERTLPSSVLLALVRHRGLTEEGILALLESPQIKDNHVAALVQTLADSSGPRSARMKVVSDFSSDTGRMMVALVPFAKMWDASRLLRSSRSTLARFTHCREAAIEMAHSLALEWSGSFEEFVETIALLLGKKQN